MEKLILALPEEESNRIPAGMNAGEARTLAREGLRKREQDRRRHVQESLDSALRLVKQEAGFGRFQTYFDIPYTLDMLAIDDLIHQLKALGYGAVTFNGSNRISITWSEK